MTEIEITVQKHPHFSQPVPCDVLAAIRAVAERGEMKSHRFPNGSAYQAYQIAYSTATVGDAVASYNHRGDWDVHDSEWWYMVQPEEVCDGPGVDFGTYRTKAQTGLILSVWRWNPWSDRSA